MSKIKLIIRTCFILILAMNVYCSAQQQNVEGLIQKFFNSSSTHANNWAVIVCTSRFWFNYRHIANSLSFYHILKQNGVPDSNIILMLADDMACNPRNSFPAQIFNNQNRNTNLYGENVEVDYRGYEVTIENFLRVLTDRHEPETPRNKRLTTDEHSNILIYMSGHGGNEFLKFQDAEEINSADIAEALEQMNLKKRYHEILFIADTCQAGTLFNQFTAPNVVAIGSSSYAENSYSHHNDYDIGVSVIDRFTHDTLEYFETHFTSSVSTASRNRIAPTLQELFNSYNPSKLYSHPRWTSSLKRPLNQVSLTDFFGSNIRISFAESMSPYRLNISSSYSAAAVGSSDFSQLTPSSTEQAKEDSKPLNTRRTKPLQNFNLDFIVVSSLLLIVLSIALVAASPKKAKQD